MKSKTCVYEMRRDGWTDYFELHVSPNAQAMRQHIIAEFGKYGFPVDADRYQETHGLVRPILSPDGIFALCFLHEGMLGAGVVAHECLHVAMAHERFVLRFGMAYGSDIGTDEERLAYFLTDTVKGVYNTLYENGHIKQGAA